jgi:hypothetical protein
MIIPQLHYRLHQLVVRIHFKRENYSFFSGTQRTKKTTTPITPTLPPGVTSPPGKRFLKTHSIQ